MAQAILEFQLWGPRDLRSGRFISIMKEGILANLLLNMQALGDEYKDKVAETFAERHGRTGETESTFRGVTGTALDGVQYRVEADGGIGFVINPIRTHDVGLQGQTLHQVAPPLVGRMTNFYTWPFGPRRGPIVWYQGGPESYSPDTEFYESQQGWLDFQAQVDLHKLGAYAQVTWLKELLSGQVQYSRTLARAQWGEIKGLQ